MAIAIRSFAKINIGLSIGPRRADGFHDLGTVYQTISLHDTIRVDAGRGTGIEIRSKDPRVPQDETNTCWRMAERVLRSLKQRAKVVIAIDKQLPVQGGLGAASSNAVATMLALERALKQELAMEERLRIAAEVGSDLPLFLVGGTVLGHGRGEQVWPLQDLPALDMVIVTPDIGVSTPEAFRDWDEQFGGNDSEHATPSLTGNGQSDTIHKFSQAAYVWLAGNLSRSSGRGSPGQTATGVPVSPDANSSGETNGGRAETPLLDLVRAGIENDFERVVFPKHPKLREVKRALEREGAKYAALSGSGSTLYGLFATTGEAEQAARRLSEAGMAAVAARTITRRQYWQELF
ncbi:MAG TPA: 4-(cytidine 5'-diphospho)-2-C-methyl-D-erythritol kinase [Terriglobales bacterium]|jgi:4-diphosphocytidyl-2-C-methyl-D-erythritol kinase|nr:4-(cytidine 5'-diphospho)-2-C-methyl-D-erythritol kinase [Terriglobales bacterium]